MVESSVELSSGENVFLFVRPVNVGGSYYGEAVVGVKESYVLDHLASVYTYENEVRSSPTVSPNSSSG